ncbi:MAG: hypothetical protein COB48_00210 [Pseudoalteromonas sp.]|nr:MAG: hypothetical protein COB48_00210 [Pseudoalteromonas sp.]
MVGSMVGKAKTTMQKHQQITDFQVLLIFNQQEDPEYRITLPANDSPQKSRHCAHCCPTVWDK